MARPSLQLVARAIAGRRATSFIFLWLCWLRTIAACTLKNAMCVVSFASRERALPLLLSLLARPLSQPVACAIAGRCAILGRIVFLWVCWRRKIASCTLTHRMCIFRSPSETLEYSSGAAALFTRHGLSLLRSRFFQSPTENKGLRSNRAVAL